MMAQHPDFPPQQKQRSTADVIATVVTLLLAVIAGVLSLSFSMFFAMAADPCGSNNCNTAAIVAIGGTLFAALRRRLMWVWPTVALVLIIAATGIGTLLAGSVTPHH